MVGVYRCSCGHTWNASKDDSRQCPACGVTASVAADPTSQDQTHSHLFPSNASEPSFSSLAGESARTHDPFAITRDVLAAEEIPTNGVSPTLEFAASPVPGYEIF